MKNAMCLLAVFLLVFALAGTASARVCGIMSVVQTPDCDGSCPVLSWSYVDDCGSATVKIERKAPNASNWFTLESAYEGTEYTDCSPIFGLGGMDYRITITCNSPCFLTATESHVWSSVACP